MATLLLFRAGERKQCLKICDFLKAFGHDYQYSGTAHPDSYYGINTETLVLCCGSIDFLGRLYPNIEKKIYDTIPTFLRLPIDIQKKLVKNSINKSPIPFIDDIFADASKGGIDWNRISSADYAEVMSAITENTDLEFKVINTPLANTALADTIRTNFSIEDCVAKIQRDTNDYIDKAINAYVNNKFSNILNNETKLQNKENPLRGNSGESKGGICCRKHKPRVTIKPLGYKEVFGRG